MGCLIILAPMANLCACPVGGAERCPVKPQLQFRSEEQLVCRLVSDLPSLFQNVNNPFVVRELGVGFGIADAVLFDIDGDSMAKRVASGLTKPVLSPSQLSVLTVLGLRGPTDLARLGNLLSFSRTNLRSHILRSLASNDLVSISSDGSIELNHAFKSVSRYIIAVEAKLRDWRAAVRQAVRYRWFANESYVALPSVLASQPAVQAFSESNGVGLIAVEWSSVRLVRSALVTDPQSPVYERFAGEKVFDLLLKTA